MLIMIIHLYYILSSALAFVHCGSLAHHILHLHNFVTITVNVLKFRTLFSLCSQINVGYQGPRTHKMLVRKVTREDPDQTASSEAV